MADDALNSDPAQPKESANEVETLLLRLAREIGTMDAVHILQNTKIIGYDLAAHRLLDAKPLITPLVESASRPVVAPMPVAGNRANSA